MTGSQYHRHRDRFLPQLGQSLLLYRLLLHILRQRILPRTSWPPLYTPYPLTSQQTPTAPITEIRALARLVEFLVRRDDFAFEQVKARAVLVCDCHGAVLVYGAIGEGVEPGGRHNEAERAWIRLDSLLMMHGCQIVRDATKMCIACICDRCGLHLASMKGDVHDLRRID